MVSLEDSKIAWEAATRSKYMQFCQELIAQQPALRFDSQLLCDSLFASKIDTDIFARKLAPFKDCLEFNHYSSQEIALLIDKHPALVEEYESSDQEILTRLLALYPDDYKEILLELGPLLFQTQSYWADFPGEQEKIIAQFPYLVRIFRPEEIQEPLFSLVNLEGRGYYQQQAESLLLNADDLRNSPAQFECIPQIFASFEPDQPCQVDQMAAVSERQNNVMATAKMIHLDSRHVLLADLRCRQGLEGTGVLWSFLSRLALLYPATKVWLAILSPDEKKVLDMYDRLGFTETIDQGEHFIYGTGTIQTITRMNTLI